MESKTILIADDSIVFTGIYGALLRAAGFSVMVANNGSECLRILKGVRPDLILLDVEMPDMDGEEVLEFLSQDSKVNDIPVIVLSGIVKADHSGMRLHGVTYLSKHVEAESVISCINEALAKKTGAPAAGQLPDAGHALRFEKLMQMRKP
jgi:CheY-like chemotaxis protein